MKQYDKIETQIKEILEAMLNDAAMPKLSKPKSQPKWTREIKSRICTLGEKEKCGVCASGTKKKGHWEEWLYDVTWFKNNNWFKNNKKNEYIAYFPLVLECEWGDEKEISYDFEKLLLARTRHRVMIFQNTTKKSDVKEILKKLKKEAHKFKDSQKGDRYFFAGYDNNTDSFKFDLLVLP